MNYLYLIGAGMGLAVLAVVVLAIRQKSRPLPLVRDYPNWLRDFREGSISLEELHLYVDSGEFEALEDLERAKSEAYAADFKATINEFWAATEAKKRELNRQAHLAKEMTIAQERAMTERVLMVFGDEVWLMAMAKHINLKPHDFMGHALLADVILAIVQIANRELKGRLPYRATHRLINDQGRFPKFPHYVRNRLFFEKLSRELVRAGLVKKNVGRTGNTLKEHAATHISMFTSKMVQQATKRPVVHQK